jgi:hypothetical protein
MHSHTRASRRQPSIGSALAVPAKGPRGDHPSRHQSRRPSRQDHCVPERGWGPRGPGDRPTELANMTGLAASKTTAAVLVSEDEGLFDYVAPLILEVDEAGHMASGKTCMLRWIALSNILPLANCSTPPYWAMWGGG